MPRDAQTLEAEAATPEGAAASASMREAPRVEAVDGLDPRSLGQHRGQARGELVRRKAHELARVARVSDSHAASSLSCARHRTPAMALGAFFPYSGNDSIEPAAVKEAPSAPSRRTL